MAEARKKLTAVEKAQLKEDKKALRNAKRAKRIDSRPFAEISTIKVHRRSKKRKRINRSVGGDLVLFFFLCLAGILSALPLVLVINNAFKPLDELFKFPPNIIVRNPTLDNFTDLSVALANSTVPFARYLFNTVMVTILGTVGHVVIASMCAYPLAKYKIPGGTIIFTIIVYSLMFPGAVTSIPNYIIFNWIGLIDNPLALILPMIGSSLGLFLMKQFMSQVPTSYIESAKLDGAGDFKIFWTIVMPLVKPAWITLIILVFQSLWNTQGAMYIYREDFKMVSYALSQIATAGAARSGTLAAVSLIMITVPITMFIISQSSMLETMATSGLKD